MNPVAHMSNQLSVPEPGTVYSDSEEKFCVVRDTIGRRFKAIGNKRNSNISATSTLAISNNSASSSVVEAILKQDSILRNPFEEFHENLNDTLINIFSG